MKSKLRVELYKGVTRSDVAPFLDSVIGLHGKVSVFTSMNNGKLILTLQVVDKANHQEASELMSHLIAILILMQFVEKHNSI